LGILEQTVDIQTPSTLYVKLEELRRFQGIKVVVLGDSLIFGRTMRDHGDPEWQDHALPTQLKQFLAQRYPDRPVMVSNIGMNGTLPVDLDQLVRILLPLKPDLVIFDVTLRSFSRDFAADGDVQTREWLADLSVTPDGGYATTIKRTSLGGLIGDFAINHWYLYRLRDFVQSVVFEGEPVRFVLGLRNTMDAWFNTAQFDEQPAGQDDLSDIVLLMKARSHYADIDLGIANPQRQALDRILQRLAAADQATIIFYATENPDLLPQLLPTEKYNDLQRQLASAIAAHVSSKMVYVGPLTIFSADNFIDHVHLNQEGYRRLTSELGPRAEQLLAGSLSKP
jgi:lysophospholipase L1-like esterase